MKNIFYDIRENLRYHKRYFKIHDTYYDIKSTIT